VCHAPWAFLLAVDASCTEVDLVQDLSLLGRSRPGEGWRVVVGQKRRTGACQGCARRDLCCPHTASCTHGKRKQCKVGRERAGTFTHLTESFFLSKPPPAAVGESDMVLHNTLGLSRRGQRHHALTQSRSHLSWLILSSSENLFASLCKQEGRVVSAVSSTQWPFVLHSPS
jgi:hypothetical protein